MVKTTRFALQLRFRDVDVDVLPVPAELWNIPPSDQLRKTKEIPTNERRWLSVIFAREQVGDVMGCK